jgi:hypothetical protein
MSLSFKQFSDYVETKEEELSEEQLQEIFGIFQNNAAKEKAEIEKQKLLAKRLQNQKELNKYKNADSEKKFKDAKSKVENPRPLKANTQSAIDRDPYGLAFESKKK